ncbi:MAG: hypothetical protein IKI67_05455, partial [Bacteroidales bacterium]|nr:hypothetical protein [Bacteroidales bacterium]
MKNRKNNLVFVLIGLGILAAISAICFFVFHLPDLWSQLLAIIASAFLGAGVTAWITNRLLQNQSDLEEDKEKNIKIHENKIETYSNFISKMWNTMEDNEITEKEITEIRTELFNKLIFYLNNEQINEIEKNFTSLRGKFDNDSNSTLRVFAKITSILRSDLYTSEEASENKDKIVSNTLNLWNSFLPQKPTEEPNSENPQTNSTSLSGIKQIEEDCYHFNIGDKVTQYKIFANGISALVLWEYNENWRTERLKAVVHDSLIFLYLSGGAGYVGVFRAKGWICFES